MTDTDYTHDPYGKLAADEQAIKDALNVQAVQDMVAVLTYSARVTLANAGIEGRTVKVQLWVTDPKGCGLTIVQL